MPSAIEHLAFLFALLVGWLVEFFDVAHSYGYAGGFSAHLDSEYALKVFV